MSTSGTATPSDELSKLWKEAINQYISEARLSEKEKDALNKNETPEESLDLTKAGWDKNIIKTRGGKHDLVVRRVSQTLGVFDLMTSALAFTVTTSPISRYLLLKPVAPVSVVSAAIKILLQVHPFNLEIIYIVDLKEPLERM